MLPRESGLDREGCMELRARDLERTVRQTKMPSGGEGLGQDTGPAVAPIHPVLPLLQALRRAAPAASCLASPVELPLSSRPGSSLGHLGQCQWQLFVPFLLNLVYLVPAVV